MKLKNIIAVSGMPNLFTLVSTRNNGLILKDPTNGKTNFYSVRSHQFTPLETVGIYNSLDTTDLKTIFTEMLKQLATNPPVPTKSSNDVLLNYFGTILPDFDRSRVYPGDVKKVIKWFNNLNELGFLTSNDEEE
jgi:hypothetical protein